jgi:predicted nucleotidyltransferase component of viral defense system
MPLPISVKRHHIIDKGLEAAIDHFFSSYSWEGIYLTGGTCLAEFYFGHRLSVDIDLFTQDPDVFAAARRVFLQENFSLLDD